MDFNADSFSIFDRDWALLTAGTIGHYNAMTIGWGGLGTLWRRPAVTVYVKPIRHTHRFMEESEYFTVGFYSRRYRRALLAMGTLSGRDCDKAAKAGLTPVAAESAVTFAEASSTLLCRKLYRQDLDTAAMPADVVAAFYETEAAHTMYVGEVLKVIANG